MRRLLRRRWKWLAILVVGALPGLGLLCLIRQDFAIEASFNAIAADDTEERLVARLGKPSNTWKSPYLIYKTVTWTHITWDKRERWISVDLLPDGLFLRKALHGDPTFVKKWSELSRRFVKSLQ